MPMAGGVQPVNRQADVGAAAEPMTGLSVNHEHRRS